MRPSKPPPLRYFVLFVCSLLLFAVPSSAHSGRTDSNGGHNSPSGYHYHHGCPAHQHKNGVCPYDYKSYYNTQSSNGTSDAESSRDGSSGRTASSPDAILTFFSVAAPLVILVAIVRGRINDRKAALEREQRILREQEVFEANLAKYRELYEGKSISSLAGVPSPFTMNSECVPCVDGAPADPDLYLVVYVTPTGKSYHRNYCSHGSETTLHAAKKRNLSPCMKCLPVGDSPRWLVEYKRIRSICDAYGIETLD